MSVFDLSQNALWINVSLFGLGALGVWFSGTKLSGYVDSIAERTGIGKAFAGALLLGGATSLPEIATTVSASLAGAPEMAGTNLLGGVVMQIAVLAVVDAFVLRGRALTFFSPNAALLTQGVMLILMIALASAAISTGELFTIFNIGFWSLLIGLIYLISLWAMYHSEGDPRWEPAGEIGQPPESAQDMKDAHQKQFENISTYNIVGRFSLAALAVFVCGFIIARTGEVIAEQSGIGQGFVGATLVAFSTSLPEVSTTISAVRFGAYSMAVGNILGTNVIEIALFLPADIAYQGGSIFDSLNSSANLLAALGILATCIYLWGILERRDKTVFGMGYDSAAVLVVYLSGMILYYFL